MSGGKNLQNVIGDWSAAARSGKLFQIEPNANPIVVNFRGVLMTVLHTWRHEKKFVFPDRKVMTANDCMLPTTEEEIEFIEIVRMHGRDVR